MIEERLKEFALAKAPEGARPLARQGAYDYWDTNLLFIKGVEGEIRDILERGDSHIKNIPLRFEDSFAGWKAFCYLKGLVEGNPHAEYGESSLTEFLASADRLREGYYAPKLDAVCRQYNMLDETRDRLWTRFNFLSRAALKDDAACDALYEEFYADGCWDPEADEAVPACPHEGVASLTRERQQRDFRAAFRQEFRSDFVQNPIFPATAMLGTPDCLDMSGAFNTLHAMKVRNSGVLEALDAMTCRLRRIVELPPAPPPARILAFRPRAN